MTAPHPVLNVVCPAYQEEAVLPRFHEALSRALAPLADDFTIEILYVDDGSSDGTLEVLRQLARTDARVRYLSLSRNFGHQAALTAGLEHARGDLVVSLDSDLQHPPALIPELVERWREGHDIVLTERKDAPTVSWFKRTTSAQFYRLLRLLSDTPVSAAASDFRLMSRPALDALLQLRESHRFLRGMVSWLGFRVTSVPFQAADRAAGRSQYTLRRMLRLATDGLLSFSRTPLRVPLFVGAIVLLLGCLYPFLVVGAYLLRGAVGSPLVHLMVEVELVLNGAVLLSLGVLGEYLGCIFEQVKRRPLYLLKERSSNLAACSDAAPEEPRARNRAA